MLQLQRKYSAICRIMYPAKKRGTIMKRFIALFLIAAMTLFVFAGCTTASDESSAASNEDGKAIVRVAGMKGPTSIGLVGLLEADEKGESKNDYEFTLAGTADEITPKLIKGELDIAAVPANLASVLYNNTEGKIQMLAINNLGVLYIVAKGESVESIEDLRGKTIYATGKGTTPEYTLNYILSENGINPESDVTIEYKSEATEVVAAISKAETAIAMLPQPYVTVAKSKVEGLLTVIDLNEEWKKINPEGAIVTGVIVVRREFAEANPQAVKDFLDEYKASIALVNSDAKLGAELVTKFGIFDNQAVIEKAIPYCNLYYMAGDDMVKPVNDYLGVLYEQNNKSVGGKLPDEGFFCKP